MGNASERIYSIIKYGCFWVILWVEVQMINTGTLKITPKILSLIAEIDEFKGAWRALGTLAPERLNRLRHVSIIENIGSSTRIEGSKLSDQEVERLLQNLEIISFDTCDSQEVAGYAIVIWANIKNFPIMLLRLILLEKKLVLSLKPHQHLIRRN